MAIGDILEGLFGGAAGGLRRYSAYQEEEAARREREAEREAAKLEREEIARRQQAQADRLFNMEIQRAVAQGILSPTEYVEYAKPSDFLRGEPIGMQRLAAGADMSSILAGQPIGMQRQASNRRSDIASVLSPETRGGRMAGGATVAPNQTYSAIDRLLAEAEPTPRPEDIGARDTERPVMGLDRVLEITPEDIAGRFKRAPRQGSWTSGRGTFEGLDGQMYRVVTPEERAVMEEGALRRKLQLQSEIEFELVTAQRTKLADELGLTGDERNEFIATGSISRFAPRTGLSNIGGLPVTAFNEAMKTISKGVTYFDPETGIETTRPMTEEEADAVFLNYVRFYNVLSDRDISFPKDEGDRNGRAVGIFDFLSGNRFGADSAGTGERLRAGGGMPASGGAAISPEQARQLELGFRDTQQEVVGPPPNIDFEALGLPRYSDEGPTVAEMVGTAAKVGKGIKGLVEGGYPVPQGRMFR
jgi:hypothetical protein